jgi:hypothetical protein
MKLSEIGEILYQVEIDGQRYALLFHITDFSNILGIRKYGLVPSAILTKIIGHLEVPFIGQGKKWYDASFFFTFPGAVSETIKAYKVIRPDLHKFIPVVITVLFKLSTELQVDECYEYSEGFPNALKYFGPINFDRVLFIDPIDKFSERFNVGCNPSFVDRKIIVRKFLRYHLAAPPSAGS